MCRSSETPPRWKAMLEFRFFSLDRKEFEAEIEEYCLVLWRLASRVELRVSRCEPQQLIRA